MSTEHKHEPRVAVIGAGIAGLAAAYELQQCDIPAVVFERDAQPGGRMVTTEVDGLLFDSGADFFSDNYTQMKAYAQEFAIPWVPYERHCAQRFMRNGETHILHLRGLQDILHQPLLSWSARTALIRWLVGLQSTKPELDFFDLSSLPTHLDHSSAADYLNQHVHPEVNDYIADPFTGAMQFHRTDEMSAAALISLMQMALSPVRKFTPRYTTGGIARITTALAERLPINYGSRITSVHSADWGVQIEFENQLPQHFAAVVLAVPAYAAQSLLTQATSAQHRMLASARYAATITVAFTAPAAVADISHCTYVPYHEHSMIGSYTFEGNKSAGHTNGSRAVMHVYLREEAARELLAASDEAIFGRVRTELAQLCPELGGKLEDIHPFALQRWPNAMPKFDHGYITIIRDFLERHQGDGQIYFAGDYLNAPWTEGASRSGIRAGRAVIASLNRWGKTIGSASMSSSSVGAVLPL